MSEWPLLGRPTLMSADQQALCFQSSTDFCSRAQWIGRGVWISSAAQRKPRSDPGVGVRCLLQDTDYRSHNLHPTMEADQ